MSRCTCLWVDGRRVDDTHCPVHDTLTGVPTDEPEPSDGELLRAELLAEMRRRMGVTAGGRCYRCGTRLEIVGSWARCDPCGVEYQASEDPDGGRRFTEQLVDWAS